MSAQREYTPPPLPRSAPIQAELTNSAKSKRIPQLYQPHHKDNAGSSTASASGSSQKHKQLPELQTSNSISPTSTPSRVPHNTSSTHPSFKHTPVTQPYRHIKTASYDERANDKKRLVDQFYHQLGTPPSSANGSRLATPLLTRNNTMTSLVNESRTNLVLNKFELDKKEDGYSEFEKRTGNVSEIGDMVAKLEQVIVRRIKEQVDVNEEEFLEKTGDFQGIEENIKGVKLRIQEIITTIEMESFKNFNEEYQVFEAEIKKFIDYLKILDDYEVKIHNSRDKMNEYKQKLLAIRKTIELGEMMKVAEHKKMENRNRWISVVMTFIFVLFALYKMI